MRICARRWRGSVPPSSEREAARPASAPDACLPDGIIQASERPGDRTIQGFRRMITRRKLCATALGFLAAAKQLGFTEQSFDECLANQKVLDGIDWVRQRGAEKFGVNSTPTFFINGTIRRGEMNLEETEKLLQPYLKA